MSNLGVDSINVEGKEAQDLFKKIIDSFNNLQNSNTRPLEQTPEENEKESNKQYK